MAAGLGFKDFVTGEVLTAADVDGYLMQGVWVFASAAARDAAVTSPQEGNFAYLKDTNVTTYYTGSAWANLDTTGMTNPMTTTGDTIYSSSGSTPARLGIGSTGQVLTVAAGIPSWATPAGGSFVGVGCTGTGNETINNNTSTIISWDTESFDTDGFHSTSSNTSRITIPAGKGGKYLFISHLALNNAGGTGRRSSHFYKNGVQTNATQVEVGVSTNAYPALVNTFIYDLVATDYVETSFYQDSGGAFSISRPASSFQAVYLGA
jgi:hypothetical protein